MMEKSPLSRWRISVKPLESCPFCGYGSIHPLRMGSCWFMCCSTCDSRTGAAASESAAIEFWNTRHQRCLLKPGQTITAQNTQSQSRLVKAADAIIDNSKPISPNRSMYRLLGRDFRELTEAVKEAKDDE